MTRPINQVHAVVVGSTIMDIVVRADRLPKEGESMMARDLKFFPGGKGANQAVGVARLGARVSYVGAVGEDSAGDFLIQSLHANGIDTTFVKRNAERSTGCAFIMIFPHGNNAIVVDPSANFTLTPADIERAAEAFRQADVVGAVLEIPLETVEATFRLARREGKLTVLDAGPPRACPPEILRLADIVSPNETELEALSGLKVTDHKSAREAAEKVLAFGVKTMVLKLGADGSMLVTKYGAQHFPAYKVNAVDPTAAGDAFTAALVVQLAAGVGMEDAIRYANMVGALATTKLGAQPSLPTCEEVETFAAHLK